MPTTFGSITDSQLRTWAGPRIFSRGKSYLRRVSVLCQTKDGSLLALVYGTEEYVTLVETPDGGELRSTCSCPYGHACKHAVAVLLKARGYYRRGATIPPLSEHEEAFFPFFSEEKPDDAPADNADGNIPENKSTKKCRSEQITDATQPLCPTALPAVIEPLDGLPDPDPDALHQALLALLAVNLAPLTRAALLRGMKQLQIPTPRLDRHLAELKDHGLIVSEGTTWACDTGLGRRIVTELVRQKHFARLADLAGDLAPVRSSFYYATQFPNLGLALREIRRALLENQPAENLNTLLHAAHGQFLRSVQDEPSFTLLFDRPFDPDYLLVFPEHHRSAILGEISLRRALALAPLDDIDAFLTSPAGRPGTLSAHADFLLLYNALRQGRLAGFDLLFAGIPKDRQATFATLQAWRQTLAGHDQEAGRLLEEGLALIRRQTRKKKAAPRSIDGFMPLFSLLRANTPATIRQADETLALIEKDHGNPLARLCPAARIAITLLQGREPTATDSANLATLIEHSSHHPISQLLAIFADYWQAPATADRHRTTLLSLRDRAMAGGYPWFAFEAATLLARLGVDEEKNTALATDLGQREGYATLLDTVTATEPWERSLKALISLAEDAGGKSEAGAGRDQRLIWLFRHLPKSHTCAISPKLQNLSKNGAWTKGRAVALKSLTENNLTLDCLTAQDLKICAAIERNSSGYGWGYHRESIDLNMARAIPALVGHPLIFREEAPGVRIDLIAGEPELRAVKKGKKIELVMYPAMADTDQTFAVVEETPTRFRVITLTDRYRQIAAIVQNGIRLPEKSSELASRAISSLSSLITVQSDLAADAGDAQEIEADPRPQLHLLPDGEGLRLSILVRPIAAAEIWHRPGQGGQRVFAEVNGQRLCATRDHGQEKERAAAVLDSCAALAGLDDGSGEFCLSRPEDCLELLLQLRQMNDEVCLHWPQGQRFAVRGQAAASGFSLNLSKERNWFAATGELTVDDATVIDLQQLLTLLDRATGRFIPLDDGSFLALTREFMDRLEELKDCSDRHGKGVRFNPAAALNLDGLLRESGAVSGDRHWQDHQARLTTTIAAEPPSTLQAELRDYQTAGFRWLAQLSHWQIGACLADDMGLGKTLQALAAILLRAGDGPSLVVAPLSVMMNWQDEAGRFAPTLRVVPFGPGDRQETLDRLGPFDLVLCSYGLLPLEEQRLTGVSWQTVVLDEAQAIKNRTTKRSRAAMQLNAEFRLITTGTPVENHLGELWTLFNFLNPGLLGSHKQFSDRFISPLCKDDDRQTRRRLRRLIRPFILRRLKSEVLKELPPRTEITLQVEMSAEETALYEAQRRLAVDALAAAGEDIQQHQFHILAAITRLRRLCCNPTLVLPECGIQSSKLKVFGDVIEELLAGQHKALVFSQFVDHLALIRQLLDQRGISHQYLDGSTSVGERKKRIDSFQRGAGDVFLISLKAGGTGLNLTAADYVIHMDPWWNPAVEDQASDRAHRIGQTRPVTIYRLVVKNSIEEEIVRLHRDKRDLADGLLAGSDLAAKISAEDLLKMLRGTETV